MSQGQRQHFDDNMDKVPGVSRLPAFASPGGWSGLILLLGWVCLVPRPAWATSPPPVDVVTAADPALQVLEVADRLLEEAQVSYVYGGSQVGDDAACQRCNLCLESKKPKPEQRLALCGECRACSIDCSHFTALVFREAGLPYPYLETARMLGLTSQALARSYRLLDAGQDLAAAAPGDLLVYKGHVVILERLHAPVAGVAVRYRGDVVHATGGKDIRLPGQGIQRERFVDLSGFRGPLLRILRHEALAATSVVRPRPAVVPAAPRPTQAPPVAALTEDGAPPAPVGRSALRPVDPAARLRPVEKREPRDY